MEGHQPSARAPRILTIGHSDHPLDQFLDLLKRHSVDVVVDTRSYPYSNFAPQYDQQPLRDALIRDGFRYLYLGNELGGRPKGDEYYDPEGHVLYAKVADSGEFKAGLARLESGIRQHNVALLCAEEDPTGCHRRLLIGHVLLEHGIEIEHIRGDGQLQPESELVRQLELAKPQMNLFRSTEDEWKSIPSVLRKRRQSEIAALRLGNNIHFEDDPLGESFNF